MPDVRAGRQGRQPMWLGDVGPLGSLYLRVFVGGDEPQIIGGGKLCPYINSGAQEGAGERGEREAKNGDAGRRAGEGEVDHVGVRGNEKPTRAPK